MAAARAALTAQAPIPTDALLGAVHAGLAAVPDHEPSALADAPGGRSVDPYPSLAIRRLDAL